MEAWPKSMSWLVFKTGALKSWSWLKHNWKVPLIILWSVFVYVTSRRNTEALKKTLEINKASHKKEIETINKIHREEIINLRNLQVEYKNTITRLEEEFQKQNTIPNNCFCCGGRTYVKRMHACPFCC